MLRWWKFVLAYFRLSKRAVCEMSTDEYDFHDYWDAPEGEAYPSHFYHYECARCGRKFTI